LFICPFGCGNYNPKDLGTSTTLVGWFGGEDPNHHCQGGYCNICDKSFTKHYVKAGRKVWFTDKDHHCLLGKPGCCEELYLTKCKECNGWMKHSACAEIQSEHSVNGYFVPGQPRNYKCESCGHIEEDPKWPGCSTVEGINFLIEKYKSMPNKVVKPCKFKILEEVGIGVVNLRGIEKLGK